MAFDEQSFEEVAFGFDEMIFDQVVDSIKIAFDEVVGRVAVKSGCFFYLTLFFVRFSHLPIIGEGMGGP
jgi:hypothetical protein